MDSNALLCDLCYEKYDLQDHLPIHFPHYPPCAKTTCLNCFHKTIKQSTLSSLSCPWDKQSLKCDQNGKIVPLPNYSLREKLEKNKDFEICPIHPSKFQKLFCKTDNIKICSSCQRSSEGQNHKDHDVDLIVDLIVNLKPEIEKRKNFHEASLKKFEIFNNAVNAAINSKRSFFEEMIEGQTQIHNLAKLKSRLMVRDYTYRQNQNVQERLKESAASRQETQKRIEKFNNLRWLDIGQLLRGDPENVLNQDDEGKLTQNFAECEEIITQQASDLFSSFGLLYDQENITCGLEFSSYLSIEIVEEKMTLTASKVMKILKIDVEKLKEIKDVTFVFDKFDFNQEDMDAIEFIFSSIQRQLTSVALFYRHLKDCISKTQFETHAVLFSLLIFSNSTNYQAITLSFDNSNGSERYLPFLGESVFPKVKTLDSLTLVFIDSDLTEETFATFMTQTNSHLKELRSFLLNIQGSLRLATQPKELLTFQLPKLENLNILLNVEEIFKRGANSFLKRLLLFPKNLRSCKIRLGLAFKDNITFINSLYSLRNLESLSLKMSNFILGKKLFQYLMESLKTEKLTQLEIITKAESDFAHFEIQKASIQNNITTVKRSAWCPGALSNSFSVDSENRSSTFSLGQLQTNPY